MDTTKEYINKCEKAVKIQKQFRFQEGDFYFEKGIEICNGGWTVYEKKHFTGIYLPRQDQLQEMVCKHSHRDLWYDGIHFKFTKWLDEDYGKTVHEEHGNKICSLSGQNNIAGFDGSMEQLWFAFVMKELYSKVWDGKDWASEH